MGATIFITEKDAVNSNKWLVAADLGLSLSKLTPDLTALALLAQNCANPHN